MADQKPEQAREDDSKKETVRITLPGGVGGSKPSSPPPPPSGPSLSKTRPTPVAVESEQDAKKETAVMGKMVSPTKPKSDTARVEIPAAKPSLPEVPKPTVKLRSEPMVSNAPPTAILPMEPDEATAGASSKDSVGLGVGAMILSVVVMAYLAMLVMG